MDPGLAAFWAGLAGVVGAGGGAAIGGAFATRGARIAGDKAIEAVDHQEVRAAASEHRRWLRQARYDAYREFASVVEELAQRRPGALNDDEYRLVQGRLISGMTRIAVLGPDAVTQAANNCVEVFTRAGWDEWDDDMSGRLVYEHMGFTATVRAVLERPRN